MMIFKYKEENTFEHRRDEALAIMEKHKDRVPVIIERMPGSSIPLLDRRKFLLPKDISVAQFIWIIRKRIKLESSKSIFIFVGKLLPQSSATMGEIYADNKDDDSYLYIAYSGENVFGWKKYIRLDVCLYVCLIFVSVCIWTCMFVWVYDLGGGFYSFMCDVNFGWWNNFEVFVEVCISLKMIIGCILCRLTKTPLTSNCIFQWNIWYNMV